MRVYTDTRGREWVVPCCSPLHEHLSMKTRLSREKRELPASAKPCAGALISLAAIPVRRGRTAVIVGGVMRGTRKAGV